MSCSYLLPFTTVCGEAQLVGRDLPSFLYAVTANLDYRGEPTPAAVGFLTPAKGARLKCLGRPRAGVIDHRAAMLRFVLPPFAPLPLLVTAALPRQGAVTAGGAVGVAYVMLIVQVAPGFSVAPQVVAVELNNVFPIPATVSPVIVTGVVAAVPWFVIVTTLVTGFRGAGINPKFRMRVPPAVVSVRFGQAPLQLVAAVKANGPAETPVPERLTGVPVPVAGPVMEL